MCQDLPYATRPCRTRLVGLGDQHQGPGPKAWPGPQEFFLDWASVGVGAMTVAIVLAPRANAKARATAFMVLLQLLLLRFARENTWYYPTCQL